MNKIHLCNMPMAKFILFFISVFAILLIIFVRFLFINFENGISNAFYDNEKSYIAYTNKFSNMEHIIVWHNIGNQLSRIKDAEVIFIGNSRSQTAFDPLLLKEKASKFNFSFYHFGMGCTESFGAFKEYAEQHNLRNKIIFANTSAYLMNLTRISHCSSEALELNEFEAKAIFLLRMLRGTLNDDSSDLSVFYSELSPQSIYFERSSADGRWLINSLGNSRHPIVLANPGVQEKERYLEFFESLQEWCRSRNFTLILYLAPGNDDDPDSVKFASEKLSIPFIYFGHEQFYTSDGSHFDRTSATLFTTLFFEWLAGNSRFKTALASLR